MILNMYDSKDDSSINKLKKTKGIKLIRKYLPHIDSNKQGYIVNSVEEWEEIKDRFPDIVTCRTDTKIGTEIPNVHGTTRHKQNIKDYINENMQLVDNPYFICLELEQGSNERVHTQGGFVLDVNIGEDMKLGYVGPGFDCGELTKGIAEHESWIIPWDKNAIKRRDCIEKYRIQKTTQSNYAETALKRMAFLIKEYPERKQEILDCFAKRYQGIDPNLFRRLQEEVLIPLWERQEELASENMQHFGVEINVVENNKLVPFEIETPEVFSLEKPKPKVNTRPKPMVPVQTMTKSNDMMTYGKAKGIVLLKKYLPDLFPFEAVKIVSSVEEWEQIKGKYSDRLSFRTDSKIGDPRNIRIEGASGKKEDVADVFRQVKNQNPDAVILLLETKKPTIPRYENDGGFNVAVALNDSVVIELVGKGFDGRELTRGKAVHERYVIPWNEIIFMGSKKDLMKSRDVRKTFISQDEYKRTRQERIDFLKGIESDTDTIYRNIPENYKVHNSSILDSILNDVIFPLYKRKSELPADGLKIFNVQGNIVDGKIVPWEIFRPERLIPKTKDIEER